MGEFNAHLPSVLRSSGAAPTGLFDFLDYSDLVEALSESLSLPTSSVHQRLFYEAIETGWNVCQAAKDFRVTPHVYSQEMEDLL